LSTTLANQIEAMSLSLHIGHNSFKNVDISTQQKLLDLNDQILDAYDPKLDPNAPKSRNLEVDPADVTDTGGSDNGDAGSGGLG
jgi:hypothetical protein